MNSNNQKGSFAMFCSFRMQNAPPFAFGGDAETVEEFLGYEKGTLADRGLLDLISFETEEEKALLLNLAVQGEKIEAFLKLCGGEGFFVDVFMRGEICSEDGKEILFAVMVRAEKAAERIRLLKREAETVRKKLSQTKVMVDSLQIRAEQDSLTKLLNASTARSLAEEYLKESESCAILVIDMDDFKRINDSFGHMQGDRVLIQAADAIRNQFRSHDIIGRIGGDEFLVVMKNVSDPNIVALRCSEVLESVRSRFLKEKTEFPVSCSIGAVISSEDGKEYAQLFALADRALYQAKILGKNRFEIAK